MATHSSILAWRIPWTKEPGGLQSMGSQRVGPDWATHTHTHTHTHVSLPLVFQIHASFCKWCLCSIRYFFHKLSALWLFGTMDITEDWGFNTLVSIVVKMQVCHTIPCFPDLHVQQWQKDSHNYFEVFLAILHWAVFIWNECLLDVSRMKWQRLVSSWASVWEKSPGLVEWSFSTLRHFFQVKKKIACYF